MRRTSFVRTSRLFAGRAIATSLAVVGCKPDAAPTYPPAALTQRMEAMQYHVVNPPSTFLRPGTIVDVRQREPFYVADTICEAETLQGAAIETSSSIDDDLRRLVGLSFAVGAPVLESIQAEARYARVSSVTFGFTNVVLSRLTMAQKAGGSRTQNCEVALANAIDNHAALALITDSYGGDIVYEVNVEQERGAALDLTGLAPKLGLEGGVTDVAASTITGESLIFGINDKTTNALCMGFSASTQEKCDAAIMAAAE